MAENFFDENIGQTPKYSFEDEGKILPKVTFEMKNGSPVMTEGLEAIRQWIVKFTCTEKGVYPIYDGTNFGTRLKSLYGRKLVGYGYEEAEIERDFREGLPECPAIVQMTSFKLTKKGKVLKIDIEVELANNEILKIAIDKIYVIGGYDVKFEEKTEEG